MNVRGIYKTSLLDYPGKIAAVVFTGGCNLRCGYCHNPDLVHNSDSLPVHSEDDVIAFLARRSRVLDGVTLSGGEPTLEPDLERFCGRVRDLGLSVKLDTNGCNPGVVASIAGAGLVDYIAVDVKTSPGRYRELTGVDIDFARVAETVACARDSGITYEVRTTCVPGFVTAGEIDAIGEALGRVARYFLHQFVATVPLLDESFRGITPYPLPVLQSLIARAACFADETGLRGV